MKPDADVSDVATSLHKVPTSLFNPHKVNLSRKHLVYIIHVCSVYVNVFVDKGTEKVRNLSEEMQIIYTGCILCYL